MILMVWLARAAGYSPEGGMDVVGVDIVRSPSHEGRAERTEEERLELLELYIKRGFAFEKEGENSESTH